MGRPLKEYKSPVANIKGALWQSDKGYISFSINRSKKNKAGEWESENMWLGGGELVALTGIFQRMLAEAERLMAGQGAPPTPAPVPAPIREAFPGSTATVSEPQQDDIPF